MKRADLLKKIQDKYPNSSIETTPVGAHGVLDILEILGLIDFTDKPDEKPSKVLPKSAA